MKEFLSIVITGYIVAFILAFFIGNLSRIDGNNCKVVVADYVFIGLTRLPCEVKSE